MAHSQSLVLTWGLCLLKTQLCQKNMLRETLSATLTSQSFRLVVFLLASKSIIKVKGGCFSLESESHASTRAPLVPQQ